MQRSQVCHEALLKIKLCLVLFLELLGWCGSHLCYGFLFSLSGTSSYTSGYDLYSAVLMNRTNTKKNMALTWCCFQAEDNKKAYTLLHYKSSWPIPGVTGSGQQNDWRPQMLQTFSFLHQLLLFEIRFPPFPYTPASAAKHFLSIRNNITFCTYF